MKQRHTQKKNDLMNEIVKMKQKDGLTRETILDYLMKTYGYTYKTSTVYYSDAMKDYNEFIKQNMISDLEIEIDRFENLYEKALLKDDINTALKVSIEINKLRGNYTIKTENKNTDRIIIRWGGENEGTEAEL